MFVRQGLLDNKVHGYSAVSMATEASPGAATRPDPVPAAIRELFVADEI
jgi:hypothetical protein